MLVPFLMQHSKHLRKLISPHRTTMLLHRLSRPIAVDKLLMGGEAGFDAETYALRIGHLQRPSTPIARSPHAELLDAYDRQGEHLFHQEMFVRTPYYENARRAAFEKNAPLEQEEIARRARHFIENYQRVKNDPRNFSLINTGKPVSARPLRNSDYFQVVNGHHRAAIAQRCGIVEIPVFTRYYAVETPLQRAVQQVAWTKKSKLLYQPVDAPELSKEWIRIRKCTDRLERMLGFIDTRVERQGTTLSYLDVGSCYGWFVAEMKKRGFEVKGVELDPRAIRVGEIAYNLDRTHIMQGNALAALESYGGQFDVVSCMSVLHHYLRRRDPKNASVLMRLLDQCTKSVLFLDTGQGHERWFAKSLPGWDDQHIERWVRDNSSFSRIERLGTDDDATGHFRSNYGRMLFACMRG